MNKNINKIFKKYMIFLLSIISFSCGGHSNDHKNVDATMKKIIETNFKNKNYDGFFEFSNKTFLKETTFNDSNNIKVLYESYKDPLKKKLKNNGFSNKKFKNFISWLGSMDYNSQPLTFIELAKDKNFSSLFNLIDQYANNCDNDNNSNNNNNNNNESNNSNSNNEQKEVNKLDIDEFENILYIDKHVKNFTIHGGGVDLNELKKNNIQQHIVKFNYDAKNPKPGIYPIYKDGKLTKVVCINRSKEKTSFKIPKEYINNSSWGYYYDKKNNKMSKEVSQLLNFLKHCYSKSNNKNKPLAIALFIKKGLLLGIDLKNEFQINFLAGMKDLNYKPIISLGKESNSSDSISYSNYTTEWYEDMKRKIKNSPFRCLFISGNKKLENKKVDQASKSFMKDGILFTKIVCCQRNNKPTIQCDGCENTLYETKESFFTYPKKCYFYGNRDENIDYCKECFENNNTYSPVKGICKKCCSQKSVHPNTKDCLSCRYFGDDSKLTKTLFQNLIQILKKKFKENEIKFFNQQFDIKDLKGTELIKNLKVPRDIVKTIMSYFKTKLSNDQFNCLENPESIKKTFNETWVDFTDLSTPKSLTGDSSMKYMPPIKFCTLLICKKDEEITKFIQKISNEELIKNLNQESNLKQCFKDQCFVFSPKNNKKTLLYEKDYNWMGHQHYSGGVPQLGGGRHFIFWECEDYFRIFYYYKTESIGL